MESIKDREKRIRQWFIDCDTRDEATRKALLRAVKMIYDRQTQTEQATSTTRELNGVGFNGSDAGYFSWVAQTFRVSMPNRVAIKCKFRMKKYAKQLAEIALDNEAKRGRL